MKKDTSSRCDENPRVSIHIVHGEEDLSLALEIKNFLTQSKGGNGNLIESLPAPEFLLRPLVEAQYILVLCSKTSLNSEKLKSEIDEAIKLRKRITSAEVQKGAIPESLSGTETLDFTIINHYLDSNIDEVNSSRREMNLYWALLPFIRSAQFKYKPTFSQEFLYIWERISWLERIGSTLIPLAFVFLFAMLIPPIGASFIKEESRSGSSNFKVRFSVPETKLVSIDGELKLEVPKVMRISETGTVTANVTIGEGKLDPGRAIAKLDSPSFTITPVDSETTILSNDILSWGWLITPKQVGQHAISLSIEDANISMVTDGGQQESLRVQGQSLIALITVLTDLGITSKQASVLKALGALLGIIGTILAYPLWKTLFEHKLIRSERRKLEKRARQRKA